MDARRAFFAVPQVVPPPLPTCPESLASAGQHLVRRIAWQVRSRTSTTIPIEDLTQIGQIALIEASRAFVDRGTASFATYATFRIRGAMIDALRKTSTISRSSLRRRRDFANARKHLHVMLGRSPTDGEMASHVDMALSAYHGAITAMQGIEFSSLDDAYNDQNSWFADTTGDAFAILATSRRADAVAAAIAMLPEREQLILQLYYVDECTLEEISKLFSVTGPRICQIKKLALDHLRTLLGEWAEE